MSNSKNPYQHCNQDPHCSGDGRCQCNCSECRDRARWQAGALAEHAAIVAWLRSPEAATHAGDIRDAIEAGAHHGEGEA